MSKHVIIDGVEYVPIHSHDWGKKLMRALAEQYYGEISEGKVKECLDVYVYVTDSPPVHWEHDKEDLVEAFASRIVRRIQEMEKEEDMTGRVTKDTRILGG